MEAEDNDCRLSLARFIRWRTGYVKGIDLQEEFRLVQKLLNYSLEGCSDSSIGNWIRTKFEIAFTCKNLVALSRLKKVMQTISAPAEITEIALTQYYQVNFKLACIYGDWDGIEKFGEKVADLTSVVTHPYSGKREAIPIFHSYQTLSAKEPGKSPNWYIMFLRRKMFNTRFQVLYQAQLQFLHWNIVSARTRYSTGQATVAHLQGKLDEKKGEDWKTLKIQEQDLFIFGAMCQMRMKTIEEGTCVLTGPWNDAEMCLVGLMFFVIRDKTMRIEVTLQLERGEWLPKAPGRNKGAWQWAGQLIFERFIQVKDPTSNASNYTLLAQEVHDMEMLLDDH